MSEILWRLLNTLWDAIGPWTPFGSPAFDPSPVYGLPWFVLYLGFVGAVLVVTGINRFAHWLAKRFNSGGLAP